MKAREIEDYLNSLNRSVKPGHESVDGFKTGDPEAEITGIAVGWMSYTWALQEALASGCNLFITHEPTFYDHHDLNAEIERTAITRQKRQFIEQAGLVILRCHDLWDLLPEIGILDSWGQLLELGEEIEHLAYVKIYQSPVTTARDLARRVAQRLQPLGQPGVQLVGRADKPVQRIAIGTGAITPVIHIIERHHPDAVICTDDGIVFWRDAAFAIDGGIPLIIVNHAVSEELGFRNLATLLQKQFPRMKVIHITQGCMYQVLGRYY
jgi:putative NIF3 family GTP cyclohydrolase 1 type 2